MQISKKLYTTLIIAILTISAIMTAIPMASAEITTAPILTVEDGTAPLTTGAVGTDVDVVGNATSGAADAFATVTVYWDSLAGQVLGTVSADVNGHYRTTVTIPAAVSGTHYIIVNDGETESGGAPFNVTGQLIVNTIPSTTGTPKALPGDSLSVTGHGFAANDAITLTFNSTTLATPYGFVIATPAITSNGTGSFSATIVVPATVVLANFDTYNVTAEDEASNTAVDQVVIDYYISCVPAAGPTGISTTISGRIAPNMAYAIRFNGAQIASGTTSSDGSYSAIYTIPGVLSTGPYTVDIVWATVNTRNTTFTVNPSPVIVLGAGNGIAGATVTISGTGFSSSADITLYFGTVMVNNTAMGMGKTTGAGALGSGLTFVVPTVTPGIYAVTVSDQYGATSAVVYFTVDATPVFMVATRNTAYVRMDFISLVSMATSAVDVDLVISDPTGLNFYTETVNIAEWQSIAGAFRIPYAVLDLTCCPITSDAPTGNWNFTCYAAGTSTILDTNLFTVSPLPTIQTVLDRLDTMEANITDVITTSEGVITALITTRTGQIVTNIANLDAKITSINGATVTISTAIGEVQTTLSSLSMDALGADITLIKGDVATIKTNLGTVTTSVSSLNTKVTAIDGNLATLSTTVGTMDGKITALQGTTATIETDVGALQVDLGAVQDDVTDVQSKADMTPVWIAVVLSLVAAIAAVFAVITIRQKIAG